MNLGEPGEGTEKNLKGKHENEKNVEGERGGIIRSPDKKSLS